MRRQLIAGNWKMNTDRAGAAALARAIGADAASAGGHVDLLVCPPAVYLDVVGAELKGTPVALGAQNMYYEPDGAFTGEISAAMLVDLGASAVILGHSERRHILGESDGVIQKKVIAALAAGLEPIVCVGELLEEREANQTAEVIRRQFEGSLAEVDQQQILQTTIAYEPVWAIGTGRVATPEQAESVHADLRKLLAQRYNDATAAAVRILYGGSVKPENAATLLSQENVDGALVGGASLKAADFVAIAAAGS